MRNTIFLLVFLISGVCFSQNPDPFWDGIRTKLVQPDTLSTFDRDALTPKLGTILYHKDTGISQWEQWNGTAWVEFGGDTSGFVTLTTNQTITGGKNFNTGDFNPNIVTSNAGAVTAIQADNTGSGNAIKGFNSGIGRWLWVVGESTGDNIVSEMNSGGTGYNYVGRNGGTGTATFTVDKEGNVTANDFIGSWNGIPSITGAASTIVTDDLTNNRALISNGSGKVAVSAVTSTELSYVGGVTSALQTQLNSKLNSSSYTAADVLSKLLTVDGSGSGLDADLLRGVHWGNVNTNIVTTGDITGRDGFFTRNGTAIVEIIGEGTVGGIIGTDTDHDFILRRSNSEKLRLTTTGATVTGNLTATGTVTATNFILSSDKRLKENFVDLGNGYYSFNFKGSNEKRYGVIAQEVKEYAPELVSEGEDGYLKVAYIDLLIKKIAELEARVKQLEKK